MANIPNAVDHTWRKLQRLKSEHRISVLVGKNLAGRLSPEEKEELETWMSKTPDNRAFITQLMTKESIRLNALAIVENWQHRSNREMEEARTAGLI